ncbi:MAG TPA: hypothetical protein VF045_10905, partial [Acidimicrobiales bacterium]
LAVGPPTNLGTAVDTLEVRGLADPDTPAPQDGGEAAPRRDLLLGLVCLVLVALIVADRARILRQFGFLYTDEDQAVLWYTAEDLRRGHVRAPYFYGQTYGSWFEALAAVPLRAWNVALRHALPIAGTFFSLVPGLLLAAVAWRRQARLAAAAILTGYLLMSTEAVAAASLPRGLAPGIALATMGVALAALWAPRAPAMIGFGLLATLGASFNESSLLVSVPAAAFFTLQYWRKGQMWLTLTLGVELGLVFHVLASAFYTSHPSYDVHWRWPLVLTSEQLRNSGTHLQDYFTAYSFDFLRTPVVPFALLAVAAVLLIARRGLPGLAATVAALAGGAATLSAAKAVDGSPSVFFPYFRFFFALPALLALLAVLACRDRPLRPWVSRSAAGLLLIASVAGFVHRGDNLDSELRRLTASDSEGRYQAPTLTEWALEDCRQTGHLAVAHEARLVVYLKDRVAPYLCAAELYGDVRTLFPQYERRTWELERESTVPRTRMMVAGAGPDFCTNADAVATWCHQVSQRLDLVMVEFPSQPVVPLLPRLGVNVPAF